MMLCADKVSNGNIVASCFFVQLIAFFYVCIRTYVPTGTHLQEVGRKSNDWKLHFIGKALPQPLTYAVFSLQLRTKHSRTACRYSDYIMGYYDNRYAT